MKKTHMGVCGFRFGGGRRVGDRDKQCQAKGSVVECRLEALGTIRRRNTAVMALRVPRWRDDRERRERRKGRPLEIRVKRKKDERRRIRQKETESEKRKGRLGMKRKKKGVNCSGRAGY